MMVLETFLIFLNALVSLNNSTTLPEQPTDNQRTEIRKNVVSKSNRTTTLNRGGWDHN